MEVSRSLPLVSQDDLLAVAQRPHGTGERRVGLHRREQT